MRLLALSFALLSSSFCHSQDWYEIEVIIFEHSAQTQAQQHKENWPSELDLSWPSPLLELESSVEREETLVIKPPFEELPFEERSMNNDSYALRVRDAYDLLWHKAWRAPLLPENQAPWILVQASEQIGEHFRLEGGIRVHLSRYLHLHSDLWLTEVTGEPIIEEIVLDDELTELDTDTATTGEIDAEIQASDIEIDLNDFANIELDSAFDWSQLPEPERVRWGCNYVREQWPEDNQLLPADFYEDPAPADWYYPFGCRIPSEISDLVIPQSISMPTSDRNLDDELARHFPELIEAELTKELAIKAEMSEREQLLSNLEISVDQRQLLEEPETLYGPEPKISYQVEEIVHIKNQRRMRSGEFHYIDHPKIGILALITPIEKPELELDSEPELNEQAGNLTTP